MRMRSNHAASGVRFRLMTLSSFREGLGAHRSTLSQGYAAFAVAVRIFKNVPVRHLSTCIVLRLYPLSHVRDSVLTEC